MDFRDLDWNLMWQECRRQKTWRRKTSADWDRRAVGFAKRNVASSYVTEFLEIMRPKPEWSVLDVGSGPGTLTLPLARLVRQVTAVDYAERMLEILQQEAEQADLSNIAVCRGAWQDDWQGLGFEPHDVAIASRSLAVDDLRAALEKLDAFGTKAVFISDRVGAGPFEPEVFKAVGRKFNPGPDYIFTVNLLYSMGIHANVGFIDAGTRVFADHEAAFDSVAWMVDEPSPEEGRKLQAYVDDRLRALPDGSWTLAGVKPARWAVIWWLKE